MLKKTLLGMLILTFTIIAGLAFADRGHIYPPYPPTDPQKQRMWQIEDEAKAKKNQMQTEDSNEFKQTMAERRKRTEIRKQQEQTAREIKNQDKLATMTPTERRFALLEEKIVKLEQRISALENPSNQPLDIQDSRQNPDVNESENPVVDKK